MGSVARDYGSRCGRRLEICSRVSARQVGDLAAFDLVRSHFGELIAAVAAEGGVVKTIGDAVMATFTSPDRALRAAMRMRESMRQINAKRGSEDLALNIGLHECPCVAVLLDERQPVVEGPEAARLLREAGYRSTSRLLNLRCVSDGVPDL